MNACDSCPNRWMADLFEALGSEEKAAEIREAGCGWWWSIRFERDGKIEVQEVCGAHHLPAALNSIGGEVKLASQTIQADRNEQRQALQAIEAAMAEHGAGAALSALTQLGLRAHMGRQIAAAEVDDE